VGYSGTVHRATRLVDPDTGGFPLQYTVSELAVAIQSAATMRRLDTDGVARHNVRINRLDGVPAADDFLDDSDDGLFVDEDEHGWPDDPQIKATRQERGRPDARRDNRRDGRPDSRRDGRGDNQRDQAQPSRGAARGGPSGPSPPRFDGNCAACGRRRHKASGCHFLAMWRNI